MITQGKVLGLIYLLLLLAAIVLTAPTENQAPHMSFSINHAVIYEARRKTSRK